VGGWQVGGEGEVEAEGGSFDGSVWEVGRLEEKVRLKQIWFEDKTQYSFIVGRPDCE
jgi:hypothetical protein